MSSASQSQRSAVAAFRALAAAVALAACSPGDESPMPFGPPKSADLTGNGIEQVWGNAPPPGFTVLHRRSTFSPGLGSHEDATVQVEELRLVEAAGWRSVVRSQQHVVRDDGGPNVMLTSYYAGPPDLFPGVIYRDVSSVEPFRHLYRVVRIRGVAGGLFPLAVGKRLRLTTEMDQRVESRRRRLVLQEAFTVIGTTDRWSRRPASVPGPVFVIRHVLDGDLGHQEVEWHYSVALGAAVYEREDLARRDEGESGIREVTLTDWQ
jgi:hypothetical protein